MADLRSKFVTDAAAVTGASERQIANWKSRLELRTVYDVTPLGRGKKARFYLDNIFELSWIKRLDDLGLNPSTAVAYAKILVDEALQTDLWPVTKDIEATLVGVTPEIAEYVRQQEQVLAARPVPELPDFIVFKNRDWSTCMKFYLAADTILNLVDKWGPANTLAFVPVKSINKKVREYFEQFGESI